MMESGARCVPSTQPISTANNIVDDRDEEKEDRDVDDCVFSIIMAPSSRASPDANNIVVDDQSKYDEFDFCLWM